MIANNSKASLLPIVLLALLPFIAACKDNSDSRQEEFALASYVGDVERMEALIDDGVDVNAAAGFESHETSPPLILAAGGGHTEAVKLLLRHRADPNVAGREGSTPIIAAAAGGHMAVVELLIANGANVNANSSFGSALTLAQSNGHADVVTLLRQAGAR